MHAHDFHHVVYILNCYAAAEPQGGRLRKVEGYYTKTRPSEMEVHITVLLLF